MNTTPEATLTQDIELFIKPVVLRLCTQCQVTCMGAMADGRLPECYEIRANSKRLNGGLLESIPDPSSDEAAEFEVRMEVLSQWLEAEIARLEARRG